MAVTQTPTRVIGLLLGRAQAAATESGGTVTVQVTRASGMLVRRQFALT